VGRMGRTTDGRVLSRDLIFKRTCPDWHRRLMAWLLTAKHQDIPDVVTLECQGMINIVSGSLSSIQIWGDLGAASDS
jgi:hypothetical protein